MRFSTRWSSLVAALLACLFVTSGALGDPRRPARRHGRDATRRPAPPPTASLGWANGGSLLHGRRLTESTSIRFLPGRVLHYATDELLSLIERSATVLHRRFPGARLTVGDLSAQHGGPVGRHRSHQSGRDADIGFFARIATTRGTGAPTDLNDYISFGADGRSLDGRYVFDTARNWAFIQTILTDRVTRIERVFVSAPLRHRLLDYARAHGASGSLVNRAALTLMQPRRVSPHDNHFHIRITCPEGDDSCREGVRLRRVRRAARHERHERQARHGTRRPARRRH